MKKFISNSDKVVQIVDDSLLFNGIHDGKYVKGSFLIVEGNKYSGWYKDNFGSNNEELFNQIMFENDSEDLNRDLTKEDVILLDDNEFLFYEKGVLFDGVYKDKKLSYIAFKDGKINKDFVVYEENNNIRILKDGFRLNGYYEGLLYQSGEKVNHKVKGVQFKDGKPLTGQDYWSDCWYRDGFLIEGYDKEYDRYFKKGLYICDIIDIGEGLLKYYNGKIYTGKSYTGKYFWKGKKVLSISYLWKKMLKYER